MDSIIDDLKPRLREYVESITDMSGSANMYICPLCGSGTGIHGTAAFSVYGDGTHWKCHSCGEGGDILDLIGAVEHLDGTPARIARACEIFGITAPGGTYTPHFSFPAAPAPAPAPAAPTPAPAPAEDFTPFLSRAREQLDGAAPYLAARGISLETARAYGLGYEPTWRHPKAPAGVPTSPRLIIPTSAHTYLARDVRADIPGEQRQYAKAKVGTGAPPFNLAALRQQNQPVFIVEGELDALSVIEAGGAAIGLGSTTKWREIVKALDGMDKSQLPLLLLALDNDEAGQRVQRELHDALEAAGVAVKPFSFPGAYKDMNEYLQRDRAGLVDTVQHAETYAERAARAEYAAAYGAGSALQRLMERIETGNYPAPVPTGWSSLDAVLDGGLYPGLYILGAVSSLGKTTFALQLADAAAAGGRDVLIFSLEMSREEIVAKSLSRLTWRDRDMATAKSTRAILNAGRYMSSAYSQEEIDVLQRACRDYNAAIAPHVYIVEGTGDIGTGNVAAAVRQHVTITGAAPLVIVDYLQILAPDEPRATDKQNTDRAVTALKRISRDFSTPVIAISSFNRDNYAAPVSMAAFKESGAIEYSSDVLLALQYDGMDWMDGEGDKARRERLAGEFADMQAVTLEGGSVAVQCKILKSRNGARGECVLDFCPRYNTYQARLEGGTIRHDTAPTKRKR